MKHRGIAPAIGNEIDAVVGNHIVEHATHGVVEGDIRSIGRHLYFNQLMFLGLQADIDRLAIEVLFLDGVIRRLVGHVGKAELVADFGAIVGKTAILIRDGNQDGVLNVNAYIFNRFGFVIFADSLENNGILSFQAC